MTTNTKRTSKEIPRQKEFPCSQIDKESNTPCYLEDTTKHLGAKDLYISIEPMLIEMSLALDKAKYAIGTLSEGYFGLNAKLDVEKALILITHGDEAQCACIVEDYITIAKKELTELEALCALFETQDKGEGG